MVQIVKLLGYNCGNVTEEVKEIIDFEKVLARVCGFYSSTFFLVNKTLMPLMICKS